MLLPVIIFATFLTDLAYIPSINDLILLMTCGTGFFDRPAQAKSKIELAWYQRGTILSSNPVGRMICALLQPLFL